MKIICALIFTLITHPLFSQQMQRMTTDFKGVSTNGKTVVAYGDYGIITTSRDFGKTWSQISIGDKYIIEKVFVIGNNWVGVTDRSLLTSTDNAQTWATVSEPFTTSEIIDASVSGSDIYVLTKTGVWATDASLQLAATPLLQLDTTSIYSEIQSDGDNIYIVSDNKYITHYSFATQSSAVINVSSSLPATTSRRYVSDLKISGGILYAMLYEDTYGPQFGQSLIQSSDNGKTWNQITPDLFNGNIYKIEDGEIYIFRANTGLDLIPKYFVVDSSRYTVDKTFFTIINDKDSLEYVFNSSLGKIAGIATINRDTMMAVGSNKLIYMTYNGGKSWQLRSFFSSTQFSDEESSYFSNENNGYIFAGKSIYTTKDGGITWLPQRKVNNSPEVNNPPQMYSFDKQGRGYVSYKLQNPIDTNVLLTNDYGDTFMKYDNDTSYYRNEFSPMNRQGINAGDMILYAGNLWITEGSLSKKLPYSLVYRYNDQFRFIDTIRIETKNVKSMNSAPDGNIYILAMNVAGENTADSLGNTDTYFYSYFMLKSTDKGKTWDSIAMNIPIPQDVIYNTYYKKFNFSDRLYSGNASVHGDYILYPTNSNVVYRFNYKTTNFDSVLVPGSISGSKNNIFLAGSNIYAISSTNDVIYYTDFKNFTTTTPIWNTLEISTLFSEWDNYDPAEREINKDAIISMHMSNDSTGFMLVGKSIPYYFGSIIFRTNIVKFNLKATTTSISEATATNEQRSIWNSPPFPLPGNNIIASHIYWNNQYDIHAATIAVYDINGMLLPKQKITIDKTQDQRGILQWDCANVPSGMYVVKMSLAGTEIAIPVIISR